MQQGNLKAQSRAAVAGAMALALASGSFTVTAGLGLANPAPAFAAQQGASAAAEAGELLVTNNYPDLDGWLNGIGDATVVKVSAPAVGMGQATLPKDVTLITGWKKDFFENQEAQRQLGYGNANESLTFESGFNGRVRMLDFKFSDGKVVVPAGAHVKFEKCSFSGTLVIQKGGSAEFADCVFENGKIKNNGRASYSGTTAEPDNIGTPESAFQSLGLVIPDRAFDDAASKTIWAINGTELNKTIELTLRGTNADCADLSARAEGIDGINASIEDGELKLSGTPAHTGTATVTVTATAPDENSEGSESKTVTFDVEVNAKLTLELDGKLDAVTQGQGDYQDTKYHEVTMRVAEDDGEAVDFSSWQNSHSDAEVTNGITPDGSGLHTMFMNAGGNSAISVSGTAGAAGTYRVTATLTYKGQTVSAESSDLRIYNGDETLADQLSALANEPSTWQMEPYEIWRSNEATTPPGCTSSRARMRAACTARSATTAMTAARTASPPTP